MLPALSNWTKNWRATAAGVLLASLIATAASAADHPVSSDAQLRAALNPSGGAQDGDTITLANDITLQGDLPVVQRSVKLVGKNFALLGQGKYRGLFVYAGTVQISDLTIKDTRAQGGNGGNGLNNGAGGGGGAGLGGALFVRTNAVVTVTNVNVQGSSAAGGNGGEANGGILVNSGGGGGGLGGDGGHGIGSAPFISPAGGGGGGFGAGATGGIADLPGPLNIRDGRPGIALGLGSGGNGEPPMIPSLAAKGGENGGGGGAPGGGGGIGGQQGSTSGGTAGYGGGGGGGYNFGPGGNAGFGAGGGGGGGGNGAKGGTGGYGGGGGGGGSFISGAGGNPPGPGGFGGGVGGTPSQSCGNLQICGTGGGGGAGMGGAIFVQAGGQLTMAGPLTISGGQVKGGAAGANGIPSAPAAGSGGSFGSGLFLQGNGTFVFSPAADQRQAIADGITDEKGSGAINGIWSVVKKGSGTTVLSGPNAYSGGTTLEGGTLEGGAASFPGNITTAAATSLVFNQTNPGTFGGAITGGARLIKTGPGTLILSNEHNSYSGGTTITAGTLQGTPRTLKGNIITNASLVLDQPHASTETYANTISGSGSLTKTGGEITLTGLNTYAGDTTVAGGILRFSSLDNLGKGALINLNNGSLGTIQTAPLQTISRNIALTGAASGIDVGGPPKPGVGIQPLTLSGIISGTGSLRKTGGGPLFLAGANTYSGGTAILQSVMRISADNNLGAAGTPVTVADNATLQAAGNFTIARPFVVRTSQRPAPGVGGILQVDQTDAVSVVGQISGNGALTKEGTGTLDLRKAERHYSGNTVVHRGTLLGTTNSLQGQIQNNGGVTFDQNFDGTYTGAMTGSGSLTKEGSGALTLAGHSAVSGDTTIKAGALTLGPNAALTSNVTVNKDGTLNGASRVVGKITNNGGKVNK